MTIIPKFYAVMCLLSLVALTGCLTTPEAVGRVNISEDQSKLVFYDAEASQMNAVFFKDKTPRRRNITYLGVWTHSSGMFPQARIAFTELGPNYHFPKLFTPALYIKALNFGEEAPVTIKAKGSTENFLGFIRFQHFSAGTAECVAFTRSWRKGEIFAQVTTGNVMLAGHYCATSNFPLSDSRALEIINSVGVKGEGVPRPSSKWLETRALKRKDAALRIPIEFNWPVFGDKLSGQFLRTANSGEGKIWLSPVQGVECTGTWKYVEGKLGTENLPQGKWSILCNNGMAATGTYASTDSQMIIGAGKDAEGNAISFSFMEPTG